VNQKPGGMETYSVKISSIEKVTHDVLQIRTDKPSDLKFEPGQATEISVEKDAWRNERRPFTFTSLPDNNFLEFTIKTYPERQGVTNQLLTLESGDELALHDVFGAINYQGEGTFIAGGAGVTPFISILRDLAAKNSIGNNRLIFANKTSRDIIHLQEFHKMLGKNFINILSEENVGTYPHGMITKDFLQKHSLDLNKKFYVCGPPPMMDAILKLLDELNVKKIQIITESF
jgi:ferredoxin-NADP reductase